MSDPIIAPRRFRVLFLCTGNSARSILAEHFLRRLDPVRFEALSAGAAPKEAVHPLALAVLETYHINASEARPTSWDVYRGQEFDFVITVCDNAREACPNWPGQPIVAHWGSDDPAAVEGSDEEKRRAFRRVALEIYRRLELFVSLPLEKLDRLRLEEATRAIGGSGAPVKVQAT